MNAPPPIGSELGQDLVTRIPDARQSWWQLAMHPATVRRALYTSAVVGSILVVINHGNAILEGEMTLPRILRAALTFAVPYAVSTASSVSTRREVGKARESGVPGD
jgi:hypothetical protein